MSSIRDGTDICWIAPTRFGYVKPEQDPRAGQGEPPEMMPLSWLTYASVSSSRAGGGGSSSSTRSAMSAPCNPFT